MIFDLLIFAGIVAGSMAIAIATDPRPRPPMTITTRQSKGDVEISVSWEARNGVMQHVTDITPEAFIRSCDDRAACVARILRSTAGQIERSRERGLA